MNEADLALSALTAFAAGDKVQYIDGRTAQVIEQRGMRLRVQWLRPNVWPRRGVAPVFVSRHNVVLIHE